MTEALKEARELLETVTPLKRDCGRLCGARCCAPLEGEETGMLLFAGEEALYAGKPGWKLRETERGMLAVCPGTCAREERPLSCRIFPLMPEAGADGKIRVRMDERARAVCPLSWQGLSALDPAFIEAVREAGKRSGVIIATGGGVVTREENRDLLRQNGVLFHLERPLDEETLEPGRPLSDSREKWERLARERGPLYAAWRDARVENLRAEKAAEEILDRLDAFVKREIAFPWGNQGKGWGGSGE